MNKWFIDLWIEFNISKLDKVKVTIIRRNKR